MKSKVGILKGELKCKIYKYFIRVVESYGCETQIMISRDEMMLRIFEGNILGLAIGAG